MTVQTHSTRATPSRVRLFEALERAGGHVAGKGPKGVVPAFVRLAPALRSSPHALPGALRLMEGRGWVDLDAEPSLRSGMKIVGVTLVVIPPHFHTPISEERARRGLVYTPGGAVPVATAPPAPPEPPEQAQGAQQEWQPPGPVPVEPHFLQEGVDQASRGEVVRHEPGHFGRLVGGEAEADDWITDGGVPLPASEDSQRLQGIIEQRNSELDRAKIEMDDLRDQLKRERETNTSLTAAINALTQRR